jgi:subtilisin family serine protease
MENIYKINPQWDGDTIKTLSFSSVLWDFDMLQLLTLWSKYNVRGDGINVYVIDTGIDFKHSAFAKKSLTTKSFVPTETDPMDLNGHGTWCCGKVGGWGIGIAPGCNIISAKVLNANGECSDTEIINALKWVLTQPKPHLINMSLGGTHYNKEQDDLCTQIYEKGCIVVAAAGNENTEEKSYPAAYKNVLAIAAYNNTQQKASFSNYGDYITVAAPGVSCYSSVPYGFRRLSGTSMASPTVVGLLALGMSYIYSKKPSIDPKTARDIVVNSIKTTAVDLGTVGFDKFYGYGGISGVKFLEAISKAV